MTSRMHPGILILDAHHLSRSLMATRSWRSTSRLLVPKVVHARTPATPFLRLGFRVPACVKVQGGARISLRSSTSASFRYLMAAAVPSSSSPLYAVNGFASCRAVDRDACGVEQDGEQHMNGDCVEVTSREGNDFLRDNVGSIHLIMGPMFAGKTTALLKRIQKESDAGRRVSLVKSDKDNRYAVSAVVSHDGVQMPCVAVSSLAAFREHVGEEEYRQMDVIGIDEAQFFDDLLEFCQSAADIDNKTVIVAGLDGDFLRRRFGGALDLIPLADSVTKLHARCELCNRPASFTFRKTVDTETEVIGGADVYMPVCRHHFVSGQSAVETARSVLQVHQESQRSALSEVEDMPAKPLQSSNFRGK